MRFARPRLIASSLRAAGVRGGERQTNDTKPGRTPRDAPLVGVDLAALVRVQDLQGLLQPRRVEQKLQVLLAAGLEELDDFLDTCLRVDGVDDLLL